MAKEEICEECAEDLDAVIDAARLEFYEYSLSSEGQETADLLRQLHEMVEAQGLMEPPGEGEISPKSLTSPTSDEEEELVGLS